MAVKYGKKKQRPNNVLYTIITIILLCAVFLTMVGHFYEDAEEEAYENLHAQTKQIKDDLHLQIMSDRENLATMANFAAKLYADGESYALMFNSFKPIGLIENIGILTPENVFMTKAGEIVIDTIHETLGNISFLKDRQYHEGTYEDIENGEKGFVSFMSAYRNENLYLHYSIIEDIDWGISLARCM